MPLDLDARRNLGELVELTFTLCGRHLAVLLSLTLLIVAPVELAVPGVWGGYLADGGAASPPFGPGLVSFVADVVVIPPLVTALHVVVVQGLARGEEPAVGRALAGAAGRLLPAVAAVALYAVAVALGLVALVVPGIWLAVRWYFAAQAVVVDRVGPAAALRRSALPHGHALARRDLRHAAVLRPSRPRRTSLAGHAARGCTCARAAGAAAALLVFAA